MMKTNVCIRHTKDGDEMKDEDFDAYKFELEDNEYRDLVEMFLRENKIDDDSAATAVEFLCENARKDDDKVSDDENITAYLASAVLRHVLGLTLGEDEIGDDEITIMDETDVGGEVALWINEEGKDTRIYVTLDEKDEG